MDVGIYALIEDPDCVVFDRAVPGAIEGTTWDDWTLVAVVRLPPHAVIDTANDRDWVLAVGGQVYHAQQIGDAPVKVRFVNVSLLYPGDSQ